VGRLLINSDGQSLGTDSSPSAGGSSGASGIDFSGPLRAYYRVAGESVVYTPAAGSPRTVTILVEGRETEAKLALIDLQQDVLRVKVLAADLTPRQDDTFARGGAAWTVTQEPEPSDDGLEWLLKAYAG